jgi:WD40 repeat protein
MSLKEKLELAVDSAKRGNLVGLIVGPGSDCALLQQIVNQITGSDMYIREECQVPDSDDARAANAPELIMVSSRDSATSASLVIDLVSDPKDSREIFALGGRLLGGHESTVNILSREFSPALGILKEMGSAIISETSVGESRRLLDRARGTDVFTRSFREVLTGGSQIFDLARVMLLIDPEPIALSDEWADLASAISGAAMSVSTISMVLAGAMEYFSTVETDGHKSVSFRTPYCKSVLAGFVPISQSEHLALYERLRKRAIGALYYRGDASDEFIQRELPRQAVLGGAIDKLLSDPAAVLSSDVLSLAEQVERSLGRIRSLNGKIFLGAAHHLLGENDRAAHLELSALRSGESTYSNDVSGILERSPWRAIWNKSEPVNTSRVAMVSHSPVLHVSAIRGDPLGGYVAACSDGTIWWGRPYTQAALAFNGSSFLGELRNCDAVSTPDGWFAVAVSSDQKVLCLDGPSGELSWTSAEGHTAPLSSVAIGGTYPHNIVASSGVDGQIRFWNARDGAAQGSSYSRSNQVGLPVEIRSMKFLQGGQLAFCAGDGFVGILEPTTGVLEAESNFGVGILNGLYAIEDGDTVRIVVGASSGVVARNSWSRDSGVWGNVTVISSHAASVNDVDCIMFDGCEQVLSASSDRSWRMAKAEPPVENVDTVSQSVNENSATGHFGSVLSIASIMTSNGPMVLTSGSEGLCRIWAPGAIEDSSLRVERGSRHVGPVNAIRIRPIGERDATIFTGGADGKVRRWHIGGAVASRPLVQAASAITALAINLTANNAHESVVSATENGAIMHFGAQESDVGSPVTLGISPDSSITALCMITVNDNELLISGADDGSTALWNLDRPGQRTPVAGSFALHNGAVTAICAARDASAKPIVIVASQDGYLSFRILATLEQFSEHRMTAGVNHVSELPVFEHGWAAALIDGCVAYRTRSTGTRSFTAHNGDVTRVGATVWGGRTIVVSSGLDRYIRVWDLATEECLEEIGLDGIPLDLHVTSNYIAVATTSGASMFRLLKDVMPREPKA